MVSILIVDDTGAPTYVAALQQALPRVSVRAVRVARDAVPYLADVDALIGFTTFMNDDLIRRAPRLRWIQALGAGVDSIVDLPSLRADITVTNVHGIHGEAVTEAAIMLMLALIRDFPRAVRNQGRANWERWTSRLIDGKTVGIVGLGAIAATMAPRLKALGMKVHGFTGTPRTLPGFDRIHRRETLIELAPHLDFLIALAPLNDQTRHMIDAKILAAMNPAAYFLNLGRGGVVDEDALVEALSERRIAGAALDVFEREPLPSSHPFWKMGNVIITPHLGAKNDTYVARSLPTIVHNARCFVEGDMTRMVNIVRPATAAPARGSV